MIPAQVDVTGGGLLAIVITFLVAWLFYAVTLHLAATFFIGDVPTQRAATAALAPAAFSMLFQLGTLSDALPLFIALTFASVIVAIHVVYRVRWLTATLLGLLHVAFALAMGLALYNIVTFL